MSKVLHYAVSGNVLPQTLQSSDATISPGILAPNNFAYFPLRHTDSNILKILTLDIRNYPPVGLSFAPNTEVNDRYTSPIRNFNAGALLGPIDSFAYMLIWDVSKQWGSGDHSRLLKFSVLDGSDSGTPFVRDVKLNGSSKALVLDSQHNFLYAPVYSNWSQPEGSRVYRLGAHMAHYYSDFQDVAPDIAKCASLGSMGQGLNAVLGGNMPPDADGTSAYLVQFGPQPQPPPRPRRKS